MSRAHATRSLLVFGLLVGGVFMAMLFGVGCSENLYPDTARKDVCDAIGHSALTWWAAALGPAALFAASQLVPRFQRHVVVAAATATFLGLLFWIPLHMIVTGNLFAD